MLNAIHSSATYKQQTTFIGRLLTIISSTLIFGAQCIYLCHTLCQNSFGMDEGGRVMEVSLLVVEFDFKVKGE